MVKTTPKLNPEAAAMQSMVVAEPVPLEVEVKVKLEAILWAVRVNDKQDFNSGVRNFATFKVASSKAPKQMNSTFISFKLLISAIGFL